MPTKISHKAKPEIKAREALKLDGLMKKLDGKTPQQIESYVGNNLNDFASMKKFAVMVILFMQSQNSKQ